MNRSPALDRTSLEHATIRAHGSTAPNGARQRSVSAPMSIAPPELRTHHSRNTRDLVHPSGAPIEDEINELITSISQMGLNGESEPRVTAQSSMKTVLPMEYDVDRTLADLMEHELSRAEAGDGRQLLSGMHAAITLLPGVLPEQRHASIQRLVALLAHTSGNDDAQACAIELIESFAAYPCSADRYLLEASTEIFASKFMKATEAFPFAAKCRLLTAMLNAAVSLKSFPMVKTTLDKLIAQLHPTDPLQRAQQTQQVAALIPQIPLSYRTLTAMKLYGCAPKDAALRLMTLEALAYQNPILDAGDHSTEFCLILNQEIYRLRMDQADTLTSPVDSNH